MCRAAPRRRPPHAPTPAAPHALRSLPKSFRAKRPHGADFQSPRPRRKERDASPEKAADGADNERERERDDDDNKEEPAAEEKPADAPKEEAPAASGFSAAIPKVEAPAAAAPAADAQGEISNEEIADILNRREQARRAHDFMSADQLREQLRSRGISIDDRTKMWNAEDGRKGMIGASAPVTDGIQDDELNKLLDEREAARRQKDYSEADRVRCVAPSSPHRPCLKLLPRVRRSATS